MSLLNEFQLQAIRDFRNVVWELWEDMDDSAFDLQSIETCIEEVLEAWETVKAQLSNGDEES